MLNLARNYNQRKHAIILKNISKDEDVSIRYLEQIIIPLKINKLVKSIRGAGGGYTLARKPSEIKLNEILHALEGPCSLVDCVDDESFCDQIDKCATFEIWSKATTLLNDYFDKITLQDIVRIYNKKNATI